MYIQFSLGGKAAITIANKGDWFLTGNSLISKNVTVKGRRTSIRLELENWAALDEICQRESMDIHQLCTLVETHRHISNRTSAIRAFIVSYYRSAATDVGHSKAGHGIGSIVPFEKDITSLAGSNK